MAVLLGVDTGGTYTDAVLMRDESEVIASAKALTTRHDLSEGIGAAVRAVMEQTGVTGDQIGMAALSTTLATNALVEGQGGRIALVYIGFGDGDLVKHGLSDALRGDPALILVGGHSHSGTERTPLDEDSLRQFVSLNSKNVSGWAVAAQFGTRNPAHELRAAQIIRELTGGAPVTCSHELSSRLNGPKRALTAVLNARLIGMIDRLIGRADDCLKGLGISAPLMVVRGDGALMSAEQARQKPIETILSGPAASIVGARWLTGIDAGLVSDIGGTTTDIAVLRDGRPSIDPQGARVGGFRTMVEAVAMRTTGLGGDSETHVLSEGLQGGVFLGPRRAVPVSLLAMDAPDLVHETLEAQLRSSTPHELDARFARLVANVDTSGLAPREEALLEQLGSGPRALQAILRNRMDHGAFNRLVGRGIVQHCAITPSDAAHVAGLGDAWDAAAARKALELMARKRTGNGERLAPSADALAAMIIAQLRAQTVDALLETAFGEDGESFGTDPERFATHILTRRGLDHHSGLVRLTASLGVPVVGLGASAATYYPPVGIRLGCDMLLPEHGGVANAIGAVVGRITMRRTATVTAPAEGRYRAHLDTGPEDFPTPEEAMRHVEEVLSAITTAEARQAGSADIDLRLGRDIRTAHTEGREIFVEATITAEASGRAPVAG